MNMGKKYIIELEETPFYSDNPNIVGITLVAERLYRVKGFKSLVFDEEGLKRLTPYEGQQKPEDPFDFSERLNEALGRFWDGSNKSFADACGVTEVTMSRYLSGDRVPKGPIIATMARVLGVSCDYLLGVTE